MLNVMYLENKTMTIQQNQPVFIRLFDGRIVGNPEGYKSVKSASVALSRRYKGYKMLRYFIWHEFNEAEKNGYTGREVYSIKY